MKIDFDMLDGLEAAGATAKVVIAMLRTQHLAEEAKKVIKRPKDKTRKRERRAATTGGQRATTSDNERHTATLEDSPRARLFRECVPALVALNIADSRARSLIASWLKLTNDDDQLVTAAIMRARDQQVVDAPGFILATLKQRTGNGNGTGGHRGSPTAGQPGTDAIFAGVAAASERRARERGKGAELQATGEDPGFLDLEAVRESRG